MTVAASSAALQEKRIKGAALDVFETEPLPKDSPLYEFDNCLLSPHCADRTARLARHLFQYWVVSTDHCLSCLAVLTQASDAIPKQHTQKASALELTECLHASELDMQRVTHMWCSAGPTLVPRYQILEAKSPLNWCSFQFEAVEQFIQNLERYVSGEELFNVVDKNKGY